MDLLFALARMVAAAPLPFIGAAWLAAARWAKAKHVPFYGLGLLALLLHIHKNRAELRGLLRIVTGVVLALVWVSVLRSPRYQFTLGVAVPAGVFFAGLVWLGDNYPQYPPLTALRAAVEDRRSREVITEAVEASAQGARVVTTKLLDGGDVEADIVGPAGLSHADLISALNDTLAESVLAVSGRKMRSVTVVGNGARGAVRVRCSTADPYSKTMTLDEVRRANP